MKILINGATSGTNFGDYLFAEMYQKYLSDKIGKENVYWYKNYFAYSDFFKNHLKNNNTYKFKDIDALVYMPGGYFCGKGTKLKNYFYVFWMYFKIGLKCIRKKIPYIVLGMEVGHSKNKFIEKIQKKLLLNASVVSVRNQESYEVAKSYGVKNVILTVDNVFAMESSMFSSKEIPLEIKNYNGKLLLVHINAVLNSNNNIKEKVIPIINKFLQEHNEYGVLISCDQYFQSGETEVNEIAKLITCKNIFKYNFYDPIEFCKVLDCCDCIVTTKLHVGIVGAKLGKSVVSFSGHVEKIQRLYKQIGEEGRTTPLEKLTIDKGIAIMNEFHDKPITVNKDIIEKTNINFSLLDNFLDSLKV